MSLREPCWQCDLDIPHVCYHGFPNARWGLNDEAIAALDAANRYLRGEPLHDVPPLPKPQLKRKKRR